MSSPFEKETLLIFFLLPQKGLRQLFASYLDVLDREVKEFDSGSKKKGKLLKKGHIGSDGNLGLW
jgi:hypothetical protein